MAHLFEIPDKISIFEIRLKLYKAHADLSEGEVDKKEIQETLQSAINELEKIGETTNRWSSLFFQVANKIY